MGRWLKVLVQLNNPYLTYIAVGANSASIQFLFEKCRSSEITAKGDSWVQGTG